MGPLPFTVDQFLQVFAEYNRSIWPAQPVAYALGGMAVWLMVSDKQKANRWINLILGVFWLWMGWIYHITFFTEINTAAYVFGSLFLLQGVVFLMLVWLKDRVVYSFRKDAYGMVGTLFILYGMVIYPLLGYALGHVYPQSPVFGVAPCPTTIFTFGMLLHTKGKVPIWLLIIPVLWSLIGFSAAFRLTIYEDMGLVLAGVVGITMLIIRNRRNKRGYAYSHS
ncbi:hypothetical protein G3570_00350 [Balneolaceae bacterium YR4-1]|uniref:Uncharacterized protein n=1 Tax=Halalkalibaculum roseum TaxID=2709311 RepID=A0A6M1SVT4_9BACT|nr:DUF6064 family protein [Halalkalibaculum roseum]NGP75064.1 hypothetical protein [Halalkalibaculum roseum]